MKAFGWTDEDLGYEDGDDDLEREHRADLDPRNEEWWFLGVADDGRIEDPFGFGEGINVVVLDRADDTVINQLWAALEGIE